ncbi:MAG TPA: hypothetical protein VG488_06110 [Candidatus Angelobacter sp.]|jgi:hypothetical protein|nr:hypothetical protein [Candidatus Angelobacter sp.]
MRGSIRTLAILAFLTLALTLTVMPAAAQLNSNVGTVTINANLPEALTVNVANGTVTIPLTENNAANQSTAPAGGTQVTTAWVLGPTRTAVKVFIFATVANPLSNGTDTIPATKISVSITGQAGAYSPLVTGAGPFGNAGLQIGATIATGAGARAGNRTDTLFFQIDTTFNAQLSAGLYTGTLSVEAQATP